MTEIETDTVTVIVIAIVIETETGNVIGTAITTVITTATTIAIDIVIETMIEAETINTIDPPIEIGAKEIVIGMRIETARGAEIMILVGIEMRSGSVSEIGGDKDRYT